MPKQLSDLFDYEVLIVSDKDEIRGYFSDYDIDMDVDEVSAIFLLYDGDEISEIYTSEDESLPAEFELQDYPDAEVGIVWNA